MAKFEKRVINPILNLIKDNQIYLTQKENLPQLAKLGYMYNTLWYGGRCASYEGAIEKNQCDDNPKYKIEMCEPENEEIDNLIYDAWGMHVSNEYGPSWEEFRTIVLEGKELNDNEKKMLKPNKTFDEWVEVLTDKEYRYSSIYPDRKSVANHLLCVIGNGYGLKDGFVILEASGADQDTTIYGDWMNATFREDIQLVVNQVMQDAGVQTAMEKVSELKAKRESEKLAEETKLVGMAFKEFMKLSPVDQMIVRIKNTYKELSEEEMESLLNSEEVKQMLDSIREEEKEEVEEYNCYYPICNYSIISKLTNDSHPSYIAAGIEICEEILAHEEEESQRPENIKFAKKFLKKFKK